MSQDEPIPIDESVVGQNCWLDVNNVTSCVSACAELTLELRNKFGTKHSAIDYLTARLQQIFPLRDQPGSDSCAVTTKHPLKSLDSQKKRENYYVENFNLQRPDQRCIDSHTEVRMMQHGVSIPVTVTDKFYYISIQRNLEALFTIKQFRDVYFNEKVSTDGFMRSHRDSMHFRQHPTFKNNPHALRIQFYFDELEVVNPLGPRTGKHQLGIFLFSVLNLPPQLNSKLRNIHPLAVCYSEDIKRHGFGFILHPLMNEIRQLQSKEGLPIKIKELPDFTFNGDLATVCADTKAAHEIFGFMSPSSNCFCRVCLIKRKEIILKKTIWALTMRTRDHYTAAALAAQNSTPVPRCGQKCQKQDKEKKLLIR